MTTREVFAMMGAGVMGAVVVAGIGCAIAIVAALFPRVANAAYRQARAGTPTVPLLLGSLAASRHRTGPSAGQRTPIRTRRAPDTGSCASSSSVPAAISAVGWPPCSVREERTSSS